MALKTVQPIDRCSDLRRLQGTIVDLDFQSQRTLSQIGAIARLALRSLETPAGYRDLDAVTSALDAILTTAESTQDAINSIAEGVGCNYVDAQERRRWAAARQAAAPV